MTNVLNSLEQALTGLMDTRGVLSVLKTLPTTAERAPGQLDVVEVREVLHQLEAGHRLFALPGRTFPRSELGRVITGGQLALPHEERLPIRTDSDVLVVQRRCQYLTRGVFGATDCVRLATAASELARNIYMYAKTGQLTLTLTEFETHMQLQIRAEDQGPGISLLELETVLSGRYVSRTGLGRGLCGTKALLDDFQIDSAPGRGTRVMGVRRARR